MCLHPRTLRSRCYHTYLCTFQVLVTKGMVTKGAHPRTLRSRSSNPTLNKIPPFHVWLIFQEIVMLKLESVALQEQLAGADRQLWAAAERVGTLQHVSTVPT